MTKVLFFPPLYQPGMIERHRLKNLQYEIMYIHRKILHDANNQSEINMKKYNFYKSMRGRLKLC